MADTLPSGLPPYCHFIASATPSPCIESKIQYGDCAAGGAPELTINNSEGHVVWDSNLSDGLDSGLFGIELVVSAGSGSSLTAVKNPINVNVTDSSVSYGFIQRVEIIASVAGVNRRFTWSSVAVRFYKGGTLVQTMTRGPECQPKADTYGVPSIGWQGVEYTPAASDNDSVVITGQVRLQANGTIVQPWEVLGKILVFASNCTPQ